MSSGRLQDPAPRIAPTEEMSPFRSAVAHARVEGRGVGAVTTLTKSPRRHRLFEVRIVKRKGKKDASRWSKLGREGWELVAVVGKHAFFRRELPTA